MFEDISGFSFVMGMIAGSAIGLILFCFLVPGGARSIGWYNHKMASVKSERNNREMKMLYASGSPMMDHRMMSENPYMMGAVTSEKQFLKDMMLHHEAAVVMAEEVLRLQGTHSEVKNLANDIIRAQTSEINSMKAWMTAWKY